MAEAQSITFSDFRSLFATEKACREQLYRVRFPKGFVCPKCGSTHYDYIGSRHLYQCKHCRKQISVTSGTVMHHTHLPLTTWFWAIYLVATDKRGISAKALSKQLGIAYASAWNLLRRIRAAMGQRDSDYKLFGLVSVDETYLGGPKAGGKRGRGTGRAKMAVALSLGNKKRPRFLRLQIVPDVKKVTLKAFLDKNVDANGDVVSDGFSSYKGISDNVSLSASELRWLHKAISNFKTFIQGTYHGRCTQWQDYMNEYCFRFNRRFFEKQIFFRLLRAVAVSCA